MAWVIPVARSAHDSVRCASVMQALIEVAVGRVLHAAASRPFVAGQPPAARSGVAAIRMAAANVMRASMMDWFGTESRRSCCLVSILGCLLACFLGRCGVVAISPTCFSRIG
jgi:hypothetical protein